MDELTLDKQKYVSSKRAAHITGYAKDYVGQLCREGRVQARLVGRNWYVLESSIMEHRFGPEEGSVATETPAHAPERAWEPAVYVSETLQMVPDLAQKAVPQADFITETPSLSVSEVPAEIEPEAQSMDSTPAAENPAVLADMQSAWQEWFQNHSPEKTLPDASDMLLEVPEAIEAEEPVAMDEGQAIHIERISAPVYREAASDYESEEVSVPVTRSVIRPQRAAEEFPRRATREAVLSGRITSRRPTRTQGSGASIWRAVFLSIAGLSIVVAIIGSGFADRFFTGNSGVAPVTNFLGGVSGVEK